LLTRAAPANEAIEYIKEFKFRPALFEKSPYMGFPTDETDRLWKDLYSCELQQTCAWSGPAANACELLPVGVSKITEQEARKLIHPTLAIPGTKDYLVQLDVWHELHCLNDLRMLLYPERYPGLAAVTDDRGVIDRESIEFRHWGTSILLCFMGTGLQGLTRIHQHRSLRRLNPRGHHVPC